MAYLLQHLLADSAAWRPDRPALATGDRSLTYGELDTLSNQAARALLAQGVAPGDRVGILAPKSAAVVVAIFGALKAGACYVPLDPNAPAARLSVIMRDSGIAVVRADAARLSGAAALADSVPRFRSVIVTGPHWGDGGTAGMAGSVAPGLTVVSWDAVLAEPDGPVTGNRAIETDPAYILYTQDRRAPRKGS